MGSLASQCLRCPQGILLIVLGQSAWLLFNGAIHFSNTVGLILPFKCAAFVIKLQDFQNILLCFGSQFNSHCKFGQKQPAMLSN
jgi:hypothetical protein